MYNAKPLEMGSCVLAMCQGPIFLGRADYTKKGSKLARTEDKSRKLGNLIRTGRESANWIRVK
jgi:hypothetical protein